MDGREIKPGWLGAACNARESSASTENGSWICVTPPFPRDTGTFQRGLAGGEDGLGGRHGVSVNNNPKHEEYPRLLGCSLPSKALSEAQKPPRDLLGADIVPRAATPGLTQN